MHTGVPWGTAQQAPAQQIEEGEVQQTPAQQIEVEAQQAIFCSSRIHILLILEHP
jgi:hypothetical protein